jgi:Zn-finger nucleic acid-binding protein
MITFKITCPECRAVLIAASPEAPLLELCPSCKRHIWDKFDALMAEVRVADPRTPHNRHAQVYN